MAPTGAVFLLQSPTGDKRDIILCWAPRCKVICSSGRPKLGLRLPGEKDTIDLNHHQDRESLLLSYS
jgi:hypothetical protein